MQKIHLILLVLICVLSTSIQKVRGQINQDFMEVSKSLIKQISFAEGWGQLYFNKNGTLTKIELNLEDLYFDPEGNVTRYVLRRELQYDEDSEVFLDTVAEFQAEYLAGRIKWFTYKDFTHHTIFTRSYKDFLIVDSLHFERIYPSEMGVIDEIHFVRKDSLIIGTNRHLILESEKVKYFKRGDTITDIKRENEFQLQFSENGEPFLISLTGHKKDYPIETNYDKNSLLYRYSDSLFNCMYYSSPLTPCFNYFTRLGTFGAFWENERELIITPLEYLNDKIKIFEITYY